MFFQTVIVALFVWKVAADDYAVVIDAGSTGSRSFVYQFGSDSSGSRKIIAHQGQKVMPGLSSFGEHPEDAPEYLAPLLIYAATMIAPEDHAKTKVYIKATAGMRLIPEEQQQSIWSHLISGIISHPAIPFKITPDDFGTIDGYFEAYYAVLASNYIAGRIDGNLRRIPGTTMIGAMDMGGSSTQLIFYNGSESSDVVTADQFWSHSWLSYGVVKVRERLWEQLQQKHLAAVETSESALIVVPNPCTNAGYREELSETVALVGTGEPERCTEEIKALMWPQGCEPGRACPVDGIEHPPVRHEFYGMSVYFFALDCVKHFVGKDSLLLNWPNPSIDEIKVAAHRFCSIEWEAMAEDFATNKHPYTRNYQLSQRCVESLYIATLLEHGFGFHSEYRGITIALEVEGTEVEWTLGYALSEVKFYQEPVMDEVEELIPETTSTETTKAASSENILASLFKSIVKAIMRSNRFLLIVIPGKILAILRKIFRIA